MKVSADPLLHRFCREMEALYPPGTPLVAAVSGGADSMALLHLLVQGGWAREQALRVAHFDHRLRPDSRDDALFTAHWAAALGVPGREGRWQSAAPGANLQERARQARYAFLLDCARDMGAVAVLTAHHRDDLAETFLERLLRGSGLRGLAVLPRRRGLGPGVALARPLLAFSRQELRDWLTREQRPWREDTSNTDDRFRRIRLRRQVLPALNRVADGTGRVEAALAATAARLGEADAALDWMVERLWPQLEPRTPIAGEMTLACAPLAALPPELIRRCLVRCHAQLTDGCHPPGARATAGFVYRLGLPRRHWTMRMRDLEVARQMDRIRFLDRRRPVGPPTMPATD
ncbi:MAG: tRNA lysidine(34) synthetase TilS [Magnetococcales bacterium]|nr:tRNA lysidine(34) synthetase TilS [Magnetococcales bacterium]